MSARLASLQALERRALDAWMATPWESAAERQALAKLERVRAAILAEMAPQAAARARIEAQRREDAIRRVLACA